MIAVRVADVVRGAKAGWSMVLLSDSSGRVLPIFVGPAEASAIAAGLKKGYFPRPMTYDLICSLLKAAAVSVVAVDIDSLRSTTYFSTIRIRSGQVEKGVDARPSDALAIGVRVGAPVLVSDEVMDEAAVSSWLGDPQRTLDSAVRDILEKTSQLATEKGWRVPDLSIDGEEIMSLLSEQ